MEKCIICGQELQKINNTHLKKHGITLEQYRQTLHNKVGVINEIKEKQMMSKPEFHENMVNKIKGYKLILKIPHNQPVNKIVLDYTKFFKTKRIIFKFKETGEFRGVINAVVDVYEAIGKKSHFFNIKKALEKHYKLFILEIGEKI